MEHLTTTIEERIRTLARETGAPDTFVEQVRTLFSSKGIDLNEDATPYAAALSEAFRREEAIRRSTLEARNNLDRLQSHFAAAGANYREQLARLRRIKENLQQQARRLERATSPAPGSGGASTAASVNGGSTLLRYQRDGFPMVPGPKDVQ